MTCEGNNSSAFKQRAECSRWKKQPDLHAGQADPALPDASNGKARLVTAVSRSGASKRLPLWPLALSPWDARRPAFSKAAWSCGGTLPVGVGKKRFH